VDPLLTFDIDWAPDFVIDEVAEILVRRSVRATWFATHPSPALERLRAERSLFEVGIHPNFFPGSTQGATTAEVLRYCMTMVPEAVSMRTHGLFQSSRLLNEVMAATPIRIDASLFLPGLPHLAPVEYWWGGQSMVRVPTFWADDCELQRARPQFDPALLIAPGGLKVLSFHPLHVFVNATGPAYYDTLKTRAASVDKLSPADVEDLRSRGRGVRTLLEAIVERLAGHDSRRLADVVKQPAGSPR